MSDLAYDLNAFAKSEISSILAAGSESEPGICAACGESLFGPGAKDGACQSWGIFWEVFSSGNVELVCSACGEYLRGFFSGGKSGTTAIRTYC